MQVSALAFPSGVHAAAANPFGDTATEPTIKNSLGQDVSVVYEAPYHALHLDVPGPNGDIVSSAYIAGSLLSVLFLSVLGGEGVHNWDVKNQHVCCLVSRACCKPLAAQAFLTTCC